MAALALVLLVRGVSGVLAAVVAAELLAFRGLAPAPHVLAVHACLPFQSGSLQIVPRLSCTLYASRALCQPGEDLGILLATGGDDLRWLREKFPTGALATLDADVDSWTELRPGMAALVRLVVPRALR